MYLWTWINFSLDTNIDVKIGCLGSKPRFVETNFRPRQICSHHKSTTSREKNKIGKLGNRTVVKNVSPTVMDCWLALTPLCRGAELEVKASAETHLPRLMTPRGIPVGVLKAGSSFSPSSSTLSLNTWQRQINKPISPSDRSFSQLVKSSSVRRSIHLSIYKTLKPFSSESAVYGMRAINYHS